VNPVNLPVLSFDLITHVHGHVSQVANHVGHLAHVLFHLIFASVVCDSDETHKNENQFASMRALRIPPKTPLVVENCTGMGFEHVYSRQKQNDRQ